MRTLYSNILVLYGVFVTRLVTDVHGQYELKDKYGNICKKYQLL